MKSVSYVTLGKGLNKFSPNRMKDYNLEDSFDMSVQDDTIILKKCIPECFLCSSTNDVITFKGKKVCKNCIEKLKR